MESVGGRLHAPIRKRPHRLVDFYRLTEKLGAAALVLEGSVAAGERLGGWKKVLLQRSRAPTDILQGLFASGRDEGVGTDHPVHEAITYLQSHGGETDRMNYAHARRLSLALGTDQVLKFRIEAQMKVTPLAHRTPHGQ